MAEKIENFIIGLFPGFVLFIVIPFATYTPHQEYFSYSRRSFESFKLTNARFLGWFCNNPMEEIEQNLKDIEQETGITEILNLPATRVFKIKAQFDV